MREFRISKTAERDLDAIWVYVAEASGEDRADSLIDQITRTIRLAATYPGGGTDRSRLLPKMRSYPAGNYLVFFKRAGKMVRIVRVIHGARNLATIFRRRKRTP